VDIVSDKLQALSGTVHTRLLDFSGKAVLDETKDIQIPAQSSAIYFTLNKADLAAKADPQHSFLVFDLEVGGKRISRNLIFFDVTHNLDLPVAPTIETTLNKTGADYTLTLQSPQLARGVYVSFGDLDVESSDNYFDLLPGESADITLKSSATLDQLKGVIKVMSLTEAYAAK
jgi:beta-mannosidase